MTMLKWVLRFFYLMIISVATVYVYGSANYSRLEAYYEDNMKDVVNDPSSYLVGINTIMGLDYHAEDPVYTYEQLTGDYQFSLDLYPIGVTLDDVHYDGLMAYIYNVRIMDGGSLVEFPKIKATMTFDLNTYKSGEEFINYATIVFDPEKDFPYSYVPNIFLLYADNYLKVVDEDVFAQIESLTIAYSTGELDEDGALVYEETLLFLGSDTLLSDAAHHKTDDFIIDHADYQLSSQFSEGSPTPDEISALGLITDQGDLKAYNGLIWRTMIIYGLVVIALTYVLFFNKAVMQKIRDRRYQRVDRPSEGPRTEAIFKDIDYTKEDGK